jgi:hypothetical protein
MPGCKLSVAKSSSREPRDAFHLPVRQAILRVALRRIRSDSCHADESVSWPEAYLDVRRSDEG